MINTRKRIIDESDNDGDREVEMEKMGSGAWSLQENRKYHAFLETHYD